MPFLFKECKYEVRRFTHLLFLRKTPPRTIFLTCYKNDVMVKFMSIFHVPEQGILLFARNGQLVYKATFDVNYDIIYH